MWSLTFGECAILCGYTKVRHVRDAGGVSVVVLVQNHGDGATGVLAQVQRRGALHAQLGGALRLQAALAGAGRRVVPGP